MGPSSSLFLLLALSFTLLLPSHSLSPSSSPSSSPPSSSDSTSFGFNQVSSFQIDQSAQSTTSPPVSQTCSKTPDPALCLSQVKSIAPSLSTAPPSDVLDKILDSVISAIEAAQKKAASVPSKPSTITTTVAQSTDDPGTAGHQNQMGVCLDQLDEALDSIDEIKKALPNSEVETMQSHFDSASDAISTCTELNTPLKDDMAILEKMFSNCRAIFDSIWAMASSAYLFG